MQSVDTQTVNTPLTAVELTCEIEDAEFNVEYTKVIKELEDYDSFTDLDNEPGYVKQFNTMIKYIQDNEFQYVAIQCGYTDRLKYNKIAKYAKSIDAELVSIGEHIGSGVIHSTSSEPTAKYGEVLFKCNKISQIFKLTNNLMEYHHCGCFYWNTLYEINTRDNVVVLNFDTESG